MKTRLVKYAIPLLFNIGAWRSFHYTGIVTWLPVFFAFAAIPLLELIIKPNHYNLDAAEEEMAKNDKFYDWILYLIVPIQYMVLYQFLTHIQDPGLIAIDTAGRVTVMGLMCGVMGINVGHELGHRVNTTEQVLARMLLLTSLYMHFFIEHNRGHHKYVGTPEDASTARRNEPLYLFWIRSITGVYKKAWLIAGDEQQKKGKSFIHNEMLHYQLIQLTFVLIIGFVFGWIVLGYFLIAALVGILLLETVNYIEHYGLMRKPIGDGKYERAMPEHSWNSDHVIGRIMLFELSRHSDHHYLASRKYQLLRYHEGSPQLPTGYPGSMILAMIPPLWFRVMNKKIDGYSTNAQHG
ncbi:MAG: alkane 1-monooxygenase [Bacteroidetes bacterium]|nr:alkane 1-monooxygenase [Bacteroidota bacterium]